MDEGTTVSLSVLLGMIAFAIMWYIILSKLTRGTFCCKRQISDIPLETTTV
jgi:hypothetical protein